MHSYRRRTRSVLTMAAATALSAAVAGTVLAGTVLAGTVLAGTAAAAPRTSTEAGGHGHDRHHHRAPRLESWTLRIPSIGVWAPVIGLAGSRYGAIAVPSFAQVWD